MHRISLQLLWTSCFPLPNPNPNPACFPVPQVAELCAAATTEAGAEHGVKIANYLCPGNYAVSGGVPGCEAVAKLGKSFGAKMTIK